MPHHPRVLTFILRRLIGQTFEADSIGQKTNQGIFFEGRGAAKNFVSLANVDISVDDGVVVVIVGVVVVVVIVVVGAVVGAVVGVVVSDVVGGLEAENSKLRPSRLLILLDEVVHAQKLSCFSCLKYFCPIRGRKKIQILQLKMSKAV